MDILNIYALGSVKAGKHLFFDTLNIKFRDQDGMTKVYSDSYSYKGKDYKYLLYFISGSFSDPALLPTGRSYCDAVLFLINPLITGVFSEIEDAIDKVSSAHPDALIVLIMQNIFEEMDDLDPMTQQVAISNGEKFCDIVSKFNILLFSLNYNSHEIEALNSGDPMAQFKFFKIFNDTFYAIIHECIERNENPEMKLDIKMMDF